MAVVYNDGSKKDVSIEKDSLWFQILLLKVCGSNRTGIINLLICKKKKEEHEELNQKKWKDEL